MVVFGVVSCVALLPIAGLLAIMGFEIVTGMRFALRSWQGLLLLGLGSLLMSTIVAYVATRAIVGPLGELSARVDEIEDGERDAFRPLARSGTREIAHVADRYFSMAQCLSERSKYLEVFATHLTHELKTPLTSIRGAAELLAQAENMETARRRQFLENVVSDVERMTALCDKLHELAAAEAPDHSGCCDIFEIFRTECTRSGLVLRCESVGQRVDVPEDVMQMVATHLVSNALEAGASEFSVHVVDGDARSDKGTIRIEVGDNGAPISADNRSKILDPFFTTKRVSGGTGMGLAIVQTLLGGQGGRLILSDQPGKKFGLELPLLDGL